MDMDKVKIALTLVSIAIVVGPLAGIALAYKDNLSGLVLPPQFESLMNGGNGSGGNGTAGAQYGPQTAGTQSLSQFQLPQPVGQPQYDPSTGAFSYPFNFTNPLTSEISIDQLSADVISSQNNEILGTLSINGPINIDPNQTAMINVTGILSPQEVSQLEAQYQQGGSLPISLANLNVDVGGIKVHLDQFSDIGSIPLGSIPLPGGK
jgi:hypothetical protein